MQAFPLQTFRFFVMWAYYTFLPRGFEHPSKIKHYYGYSTRQRLKLENLTSPFRVSGSGLGILIDVSGEEPALAGLADKTESSPTFRITGRLNDRTPDVHHAHPYVLTVESVFTVGSATE